MVNNRTINKSKRNMKHKNIYVKLKKEKKT